MRVDDHPTAYPSHCVQGRRRWTGRRCGRAPVPDAEPMEATVRIADGDIEVTPGLLTGEPDVTVTADGRAWLAFVAREFGRCFLG